MGGYRKNPNWDWEDAVGGLAVVIALLVIAVIVTLIILLATELVRIYRERARAGSEIGRFLWTALAGLILCWGVAALLIAFPATHLVGFSLGAWSFLTFVIGVEVVDWRASNAVTAYLPADAALPDVLRPWADAA